MADRHIDIQEMESYSNTFLATVAQYQGPCPMPAYLLQSHRQVLERVSGLLQRKVTSKSAYHSSHAERRVVSDEVSTQLALLFGDLLAAEARGQINNFLAYFPTHRKADIGKSVADRKASLSRCLTALDSSPGLPGVEEWKKTLSDLSTRFASVFDETSRKDLSKWSDDKEFIVVRQEWRRSWLACKRGMEATLLLEGRESELPAYFPDLLANKGKAATPALEETEAPPNAE